MSAAEVQEFASSAVKSGADSPEMIGLQTLGSMGHMKGNTHRDLMRKHFGSLQAPQPWKVRVPLQQREDGQYVTRTADCWLLLPHMWILALEEGGILESLTCTDEDLVLFWKSQKKNPQMTEEVWKSLNFKLPATLPLPFALHGDAAPFTEMDSLQVISFRCLLASRSVGESQLLLGAVPKAAGTKEGWNLLMEELAWSFKALYEGKCPKKNRHGTEMCLQKRKKMRRGILWAITGDLEWFAQEFGWPYPASNHLCPYCAADQFMVGSERPFTDFRSTAKWRESVLSEKKLEEKYGSHPLLQVPGASVLTLKLDVLHVLDLGVAAYLHGSVLITIMNGLGGTKSHLAYLAFIIVLSPQCSMGWIALNAVWAGQSPDQVCFLLGVSSAL